MKKLVVIIIIAFVAVCMTAVGCTTSNNAQPVEDDDEPMPSQITSQLGGTSNTNAPVVDGNKPTEEELWKRFLDGDFTVIAGTWENAAGHRLVIAPDGAMGEVSSQDGVTGYPAISYPRMNQDEHTFAREGVYRATMGTQLTDPKEIAARETEFLPAVGVIIFPAGQEIIVSDTPGNAGNPFPVDTDQSQIRFVLTQNTLDGWLPDNQDQIY